MLATIATAAVVLLLLSLSSTANGLMCYQRANSTDMSNGMSAACPTGVTACVSVTYNRNSARCGSCSKLEASHWPYCTECTKDNCNPQVSVMCFGRNNSMASVGGTLMMCYGRLRCHTAAVMSAGGTAYYAGCGPCGMTTMPGVSCRACKGAYCNYMHDTSVPAGANSAVASAAAVLLCASAAVLGGRRL